MLAALNTCLSTFDCSNLWAVVFSYAVPAIVGSMVLLVVLWAIGEVCRREQIEPWRRFKRESDASTEPRLEGTYLPVASYGHVNGHRIMGLSTALTESGLRVQMAFILSRLLYPTVFLRWSQIESLTEEAHISTGEPGWEQDMLAALVLSSPKRRTIVVPWNSFLAKFVPDSVRYVPLKELPLK